MAEEENRLLAFDIFGGGLSFMYACYVGSRLIQSGQHRVVMAVTSEIENNADIFPDKLLGLEETGSAVSFWTRLRPAKQASARFTFHYDTRHMEAFELSCQFRERRRLS